MRAWSFLFFLKALPSASRSPAPITSGYRPMRAPSYPQNRIALSPLSYSRSWIVGS